MERISGFDELAASENFFALYLEQFRMRNVDGCWNWFLRENQFRGGQEPGLLLSLVEQIRRDFPIDGERIYVLGFSSGAAMANILLQRYSDVFAAAAFHSGVSYSAAENFWSAQEVLERGSDNSPAELGRAALECAAGLPLAPSRPAIVLHGSSDHRVESVSFEQELAQLIWVNVALDDGANNASVSSTPQKTEFHAPEGECFSYTVRS